MQYQQLKQVPPPSGLLLLSFPWTCFRPLVPCASASCWTAHCCAGTYCHCPCPCLCPICLFLCLRLTLLLLPPLSFHLPLLMALLLPFHLLLPTVLAPFRLPLPFAPCPLALAL